MENLPSKNNEEIKWLRLDEISQSGEKWFRTIDIVEKDIKTVNVDLLPKIQKLEDVEMSMNKNEVPKRKPKFMYSKEELLKLRNHPLSMKPINLQENLKSMRKDTKDDNELKKSQIKKHGLSRNSYDQNGDKFESKKNENIRGQDKLSNKNRSENDETRKLADPKERLRKEQQDICLSPQRKSFNTGCFVANNSKNEHIPNNNSTNNSNKQNTENVRENRESNKENKNFRENQRRIGSGRIISRDPRNEIRSCYPDSNSSSFPEFHQNRSYCGSNKEIPTVVYERRFQGNSTEKDREKIWDRQKLFNNHFDRRNNRHQYSDYHRDDEEEEPEWMKEGPNSLNDVIELKGFDEHEEKIFRGRKNSKTNNLVFRKTGQSATSYSATTESSATIEKDQISMRNSESDASSGSSDIINLKNLEKIEQNKATNEENTNNNTTDKENEEDTKMPKSAKLSETTSIQLDLEEILKLDLLPDLSANTDSNESAGSKFTRWFKREDSVAPINGEQNGLESTKNDIRESVSISSINAFRNTDLENNKTSSNLLELLRGQSENHAKMNMKALEATGKLHSLEEIEAKLRGTDNNKGLSNNSINDRKKKEKEAEAFKKLLSQAFLLNDANKKPVENFNLTVQKMRNEKTELGKLETLCNGEKLSNFYTPVTQSQMVSVSGVNPQVGDSVPSSDILKLFQMQQNKQPQQDMLSKMLLNTSTNYNTSSSPSNVRQSNLSSANGPPYSNITQEIQMMINSIQPTKEIMQRQETLNIFRGLRSGELTQHQLVEQLKKTSPYHTKFRESVLCVLKCLQSQCYNSTPVLGNVVGVPFNIPPPPLASSPCYSENLIQQMLVNPQYRNGFPNIIYQREFNTQNQNMYQNSMMKKHLSDQSQTINQNSGRINSPATVITSPSGIMATSRNSMFDDNNKTASPNVPVKSSSTSSSFSMLPTSVLRNKAAEKENLEIFSKDMKEPKTGEKNSVVPYSSGGAGNVYLNHGVLDHFNNFGTCLPPPSISGQYFVGNMIRPTSIAAQVPIFGGSHTSLLTRVSVAPSSTTVITRGKICGTSRN